MEVWATDLCAVRISMRGPVNVKPEQDDYLSSAILKVRFCQLNAGTSHIKHECFSAIQRLKRYREAFTWAGEAKDIFINSVLLHRDKTVSFSLR